MSEAWKSTRGILKPFVGEDKPMTDIEKITFLVEDTYKCSEKYKESLRERLCGLSLDQLGTPINLHEGNLYQVVGECDAGQEISIGVYAIKELSAQQAIKEAWCKILSTFQWKVSEIKRNNIKTIE